MDEGKILTIDEFATAIRTSRQYVYNLINTNRLEIVYPVRLHDITKPRRKRKRYLIELLNE